MHEWQRQPAAWLVENVDAIAPGGLVLDVAAGGGRHARFLAERGFRVHAVDRDISRLASLVRQHPAAARVTVEAVDLEAGTPDLGVSRYDAVVVINYLHRPLIPALVAALGPGGVLIYETFTVGQAARGRPRNPDFLLRPGELPTLVSPLRVVRAREGDYGGSLIASIVAVRDDASGNIR